MLKTPVKRTRLVRGVGTRGKGVYESHGYSDGKRKQTYEYSLWCNMLSRAYSEDYKKKHTTYEDVTVSEDFHNFQDFCMWCEGQVGFRSQGYHLDKDILVYGNKEYSPSTCVFVPGDINRLMTKCDVSRSRYSPGVSLNKHGSYVAKMGRLDKHVGSFPTAEAAFIAYKFAKEARINEVAEIWKDRIDMRVYAALMNYRVEIN